jgi:hypothetical protein
MDIMSPLPRTMNRAQRELPVLSVAQAGPDTVEVINTKGEHVRTTRRGAATTADVDAAVAHLASLGWDRAQARAEILGATALTFVNGAYRSHMQGGWADFVATAVRWRQALGG